MEHEHEALLPIARLSRDLVDAATILSPDEARFLVDAYYIMQEGRKRADNQSRSMEDEPHAVLAWLATQSGSLERQVARALDRYSNASPLGQWARDVVGIGPIISAGLLAHIDITKAPTVGHIWRFAGLDPTSEWKKGERRPWNASLKVLCWKIGESFLKLYNHEDCFYGHIYAERKLQEVEKNERGEFKEQAARALERKKYRKETEAYKAYIQGKLPPAHLNARAKRYAVKLFLAHYHGEAYQLHYGTAPPKPYAIAILGHAHEIKAE